MASPQQPHPSQALTLNLNVHTSKTRQYRLALLRNTNIQAADSSDNVMNGRHWAPEKPDLMRRRLESPLWIKGRKAERKTDFQPSSKLNKKKKKKNTSNFTGRGNSNVRVEAQLL